MNEDKGKISLFANVIIKISEKFFTFINKNQKVTYCRRCINFGRSDDCFIKFYINIPILDLKAPEEPSVELK